MPGALVPVGLVSEQDAMRVDQAITARNQKHGRKWCTRRAEIFAHQHGGSDWRLAGNVDANPLETNPGAHRHREDARKYGSRAMLGGP